MTFAPVCPEGATGLKFRGLTYLDGKFDYEIFCDGSSDYPYLTELTQLSASSGFSIQSTAEKQALSVGMKAAFTSKEALRLTLLREWKEWLWVE